MLTAEQSNRCRRLQLPDRLLKSAFLNMLALAFILLAGTPSHAAPNDAEARPNVLLILADDLGYSDLGCYGGEIRTPNLDALASGGLRFSQFYNTARCWPSRAAILTGFYAQQVRRDTVPGIPSGGRGIRPTWAPLLPKLLKPAGYRSYHSGKWHLDGMPIENGFDRSYYLRDQGRFFNPKVHWKDDQKLPAVEPGSGFYGTTAIADHAIECLQEHADAHSERPFFHYLAFTAPHFPLHALPEDIARYHKTYLAGWARLRQDRYEKQKRIGLEGNMLSMPERELGPPYDFPDAIRALGPGEVNRPVPWAKLTDTQAAFQASKMSLHAAMVDRMDQEIGRVLAQLRAMDAFENTLILFLSDNGASAEIMVRDDGHDPAATHGSAQTYLCLGPGWSTACNTPFRRHKTWVHEGGISTPLIAHWPVGIREKGAVRNSVAHVIDLLPTVLDVAELDVSDAEAVTPGLPRPGVSLLPVLKGSQWNGHDYLWWAHEQNRALRSGDWKIVASGKDSPWELYNLATDRAESANLADQHPARLQKLADQWERHWKATIEVASKDVPPATPRGKPKTQRKTPPRKTPPRKKTQRQTTQRSKQ